MEKPTILESLGYLKKWIAGALGEIPAEHISYQSLHYYLFNLYAEAPTLRVILWANIRGNGCDSKIKKPIESLLAGEEILSSPYGWQKQVQYPAGLTINYISIITYWDHVLSLEEELEKQRLVLKPRAELIKSAYDILKLLPPNMDRLKIPEVFSKIRDADWQIRLAVRLLKQADSDSFSGDQKVFEDALIASLQLPPEDTKCD